MACIMTYLEPPASIMSRLWVILHRMLEQNPICTAATVMAGPASIDKVAGTHFLMYGGFSYNQPNNRCGSDIEDFMFDTWDAHGVTNQTVMMNNVGWSAYRFGIQIYIQNFNSVAGLHDYIYNNTVYNNNLIGSSGFGDINIQMDNSTAPTITAYNNIAVSTQSGDCGLLLGGRYGPNHWRPLYWEILEIRT